MQLALADRSRGFVYIARKIDPERVAKLKEAGIVGLFAAGLAFALARGDTDEEALAFASARGADAMTRRGVAGN